MDWQQIETAPRDGTKIDLWAKYWRSEADDFIYRRFASVYWRDKDKEFNSWPDSWVGLDKGWFPTHWMTIAEGPRS